MVGKGGGGMDVGGRGSLEFGGWGFGWLGVGVGVVEEFRNRKILRRDIDVACFDSNFVNR